MAIRCVLPDDIRSVQGFSNISHIVHLNLKEEQLPYKTVIGQILLEKLKPRCRTVINKIENVSTKFRTINMELLAGDENYIATEKENGCTFKLDFSKGKLWESISNFFIIKLFRFIGIRDLTMNTVGLSLCYLRIRLFMTLVQA